MFKNIFLLFIINVALLVVLKANAQINSSSSSGETLSTQDQLDQVERDTSDGIARLKKEKDRKTAKRLKIIERNVIRALNSVPPAKCLSILDKAMQSFFDLVSELSTGISCGPAIIPPFLPGTNNIDTPITPDCILPPEMRAIPFNGAFSLVNPIYENAREVFRIDENENEMPDVCEGQL